MLLDLLDLGSVRQHFKADSVAVLGLYKIIYVAFDYVRLGDNTSLDFKIIKAHIKVSLVYVGVGNKGAVVGYLVEIITGIRTVELIELLQRVSSGSYGA